MKWYQLATKHPGGCTHEEGAKDARKACKRLGVKARAAKRAKVGPVARSNWVRG